MPFLASALTFDALLAAVPFFLLLFAGLGRLLTVLAGEGPVDPQALIERFLPPHVTADGRDPFDAVERILGRLVELGRSLSLVAIPLFLWFSTRLFAGVRTALNNIFDVSVRPPKGHYLTRYLLAKLRDLVLVLVTLVLFLANTALSSGLALLQAYTRSHGGREGSLVTSLQRGLGEVLAFGFLLALFYLVYRHASVRRVRPQAALVAALFMSGAFEVAKRLFGIYLREATGWGAAALDASLGAVILFVVWLYYSALVFLLGGVVAETWELRVLQRSQRGAP